MHKDDRVVDVELLITIIQSLQKTLNEFKGLPHSLGYEFTHTPQIEALIKRIQSNI